MLQHVEIEITVAIENTGFRLHVLRGACRFNMKGCVKQSGGKIIVNAEGEKNSFPAFIEWCSNGPNGSQVVSLSFKEKVLEGFSDFYIL